MPGSLARGVQREERCAVVLFELAGDAGEFPL